MSHDHSDDGHMFGSTDHADSAGQAWEGRAFQENPFAHDDGSAPAELVAALDAFRSLALDHEERALRHMDVVQAVRGARFLIPLIAEAGDLGITDTGLTVDKTQELAIVTVEGPGGQRVLPVFSSVEAMARWRADARPVPADGQRVALAAARDGAHWVVIDPTSATEFVLRRPVVAAVAQGLPWIPSHVDPQLQDTFDRSIEDESFVRGIRLVAGDPDARGHDEDLVVQVSLPQSLDEITVNRVVEGLMQKWAQEPIFSQRVDSMRLVLVPAL
ncbi:hypothetical protein M2119_001010 [Aurantimicrobium minutum]|uniref:SseB family protein n=1 Tax=Aurantimicrobium minutum TaxID=708131 RepID=UPI002476E636|nr:SseB family protein [Aurantimicrobium minutum]MDH6532773.1 hypothetical protein [Aurantimicrobium minutum]